MGILDPYLFDRAKRGDAEAIELLLKSCQPNIRAYASRSCASANYVDDAIQDTLIQVYRRVGSLKHVVAFPRWLFTVVWRVCKRLELQFIRQASLDDFADSLFSRRTDEDLRIDVSAAIDALPTQYQTVVILRDFEELSISEIADELNITREAAKSRIHRARAMIREYLLGEDK